MIGDPANLFVRTGFPRLSAAEIAPFRERSTSFDVDAVDGRGALDHAIEPLDPNSRQRAHGAGLRARQPGGARGPRPDRAGRRPGESPRRAFAAPRRGDNIARIARLRGAAGVVTDDLARRPRSSSLAFQYS